MGLFDGMQFNPQSYGGDLPGLLARLLPSLQNPNGATTAPGFQEQQELPRGGIAPSAGSIPNQGQSYNMPVGNQQMPVFGMPDQSALPQNATPTQGQMQPGQQMPAQQPSGGGFLQSIDDNLQSFGNGGSIIGALTGRSPTNQTMQALIARGLEPALAQQIARDPGMMRAVLPHLMAPQGQTDDIKEYNFAKKEDPTLTFSKFMAGKRATSGEYSLTPVYGTNEKGETVLIQPGKSGTATQTVLPAGVKVSSGVEKIDLGTRWGLYNKRTGQIEGYEPKDLKGAEAAKVEGKEQGEAVAAYQSMVSKMPGLTSVVKKLDELSGRATYTAGGRLYDAAAKEIGSEPRDSAVARAEYVSIVDNQILPLLRDTFGAAFTQKEGDTLRETLGDPNASPKEKQAKLRAFIEQKQRDIEALAVRTGQTTPAAAPQAAPSGAVRRYNPATGRIE